MRLPAPLLGTLLVCALPFPARALDERDIAALISLRPSVLKVEASDALPAPSARRMFRKAWSARSAKLTLSSGWYSPNSGGASHWGWSIRRQPPARACMRKELSDMPYR